MAVQHSLCRAGLLGFLMTRLVSLIRAHFNVSKKNIYIYSMCTLHIENPSNSVSVQAVQKTHKIISFQYNNKPN